MYNYMHRGNDAGVNMHDSTAAAPHHLMVASSLPRFLLSTPVNENVVEALFYLYAVSEIQDPAIFRATKNKTAAFLSWKSVNNRFVLVSILEYQARKSDQSERYY